MSARAMGWIKLHRRMADADDRIWNSPEPFDARSARIDILLLAKFAPGPYTTHYGTDLLERGEFVGSERFLAARWRWPKTRVHRFLKRCIDDDFIADQRLGQHGRVYRVVNYDSYQGPPTEAGPTAGPRLDHVWTKEEEGKKVRTTLVASERQIAPNPTLLSFARCWAEYPRRKGGNSRVKAEKAYLARVRQGVDEDYLYTRTKLYKRYCELAGRVGTEFVLMASTFYGPDRRYDDDWEPPVSEGPIAGPHIPGARDDHDARRLRAAGF